MSTATTGQGKATLRRFSKRQRHQHALATENLPSNRVRGADDKVGNECGDDNSSLLNGAVAEIQPDHRGRIV